MNQNANYLGGAKALLGEPKTLTERIVYKIVMLSAVGIPISFIMWGLAGVGRADSMHLTLFQRIAIGFAAVCGVTFVLFLPLGGMLMLGRQAGYKNPLAQVGYVFLKVCLILLLPCLVLTLLMIAIIRPDWFTSLF